MLQKGIDGEEITSCNYGGPLRELRITVCECTAYVDRRAVKPPRQIGYVRTKPGEKDNVTVIRIA